MDELSPGQDTAEGLTPIGPPIHCGTTPDEVQRLQIDHFLDALSDVALSVAARNFTTGTGETA